MVDAETALIIEWLANECHRHNGSYQAITDDIALDVAQSCATGEITPARAWEIIRSAPRPYAR